MVPQCAMELGSRFRMSANPGCRFNTLLVLITAIVMTTLGTILLRSWTGRCVLYGTSQAHFAAATTCAYSFEQSAAKILSDTEANTLRELVKEPETLNAGLPDQVIARHTKFVQELFTKGFNADAGLKFHVRNRLQPMYEAQTLDPWGNPYLFYIPDGDAIRQSEVEKLIAETYGESQPRLIYVISCGPDGQVQWPLGQDLNEGVDLAHPVSDDITNLRGLDP